MKEGQDRIYYVTADNIKAARNSPHLEIFRKKGIEVLLLSEHVDEWMVSQLPEFEGKPLQSVAKGDLDLGKLEDEAEKKEREKEAGEFKDFVEKIQTALGDQVQNEISRVLQSGEILPQFVRSHRLRAQALRSRRAILLDLRRAVGY